MNLYVKAFKGEKIRQKQPSYNQASLSIIRTNFEDIKILGPDETMAKVAYLGTVTTDNCQEP